LEGLGKEFPSILEKNSFIVAGINFGCGSSREHAVTCLKYAGVAGVIANGFARIFYRNAINLGFPVIQCPAAVGSIKNRDVIAINFSAGKIMVRKNEFFFPQLPADIMNIFKVGGLVNYAKKLFEQNRKNNI
jgi:3-isopropylmalate/(R)-2-methylmalate dehydratase small subunit